MLGKSAYRFGSVIVMLLAVILTSRASAQGMRTVTIKGEVVVSLDTQEYPLWGSLIVVKATDPYSEDPKFLLDRFETNTDRNGEFSIDVQLPVDEEGYILSHVVVVSFLKDKDVKIAVTDGDRNDAGYTIFLVKEWKHEDVKIDYGSIEDVNHSFEACDFWEIFANSMPEVDFSIEDEWSTVVKDNFDSAAVVFYDSYRAIRYFEDYLGQNIDFKTPVIIRTYQTRRVGFGFVIPGTYYWHGDGSIDIHGNISAWSDDNIVRKEREIYADNREWHELSHHLMNEIYGDLGWVTGANHGGYINDNSSDSLAEGFATFFSTAIAAYYEDPEPWIYTHTGQRADLELGYEVWDPMIYTVGEDEVVSNYSKMSIGDSYEEFAVASILWDIYDDNPVIKPEGNAAACGYAFPDDNIKLGDIYIYELFEAETPKNLEELYDALRKRLPADSDNDGLRDIDEIFIMHGAFRDTIRNFRFDGDQAKIAEDFIERIREERNIAPDAEVELTEEEGKELLELFSHFAEDIGETGSSEEPEREERQSRPPIAGSYILAELRDPEGNPIESGVLRVNVEFDPPYQAFNYEYSIMFTSPFLVYFEMPPPRLSVVARIRAFSAGYFASRELILDNMAYWKSTTDLQEGQEYFLAHTFVLAPPKLYPWDVVGDGEVNILDLVGVGQCLGREVEDGNEPLWEAIGDNSPSDEADVNGDGVVDILDIVLVAKHFGEAQSPAAPPSSMQKVDRRYIPLLTQIYSVMESNPSPDRDFLAAKSLLYGLIFDTRVSRTIAFQNYPNPFNPDTWIPYQLSEDAYVVVRIYTSTGQLAHTLDLGYKASGFYKEREKAAYWDGRNELGEQMASGVYFYSIQAGDYVSTKKMVVAE